MLVRDHYADAAVTALGARKVAEYDAVLDVMAGEQDTAVIERIPA